MISVIVPTMWKPPHMHRMLPMLDANRFIDEIILIDNAKENADQELLSKLTKLVYLPQESNIYVNPAWNLGAKTAKNDVLFILNDDCLINIEHLESIYNETTPDKGMLGFSFLSYCTYTIDKFKDFCNSGFGSEISFEVVDPANYPTRSGMSHPFYGSAFFIHKDSYYEIPSEFKIHYGDLYIFLSNLKAGKLSYTIEDGLVMTDYSTTVSLASKEILDHEADIMKQVFAEHGLKNITYSIPGN